jgi:hypothetical protein
MPRVGKVELDKEEAKAFVAKLNAGLNEPEGVRRGGKPKKLPAAAPEAVPEAVQAAAAAPAGSNVGSNGNSGDSSKAGNDRSRDRGGGGNRKMSEVTGYLTV